MNPRTAAAVAAGGVVGAVIRWGLAESLDIGSGWPWATFTANLVGCLVLGALVGRFHALLDNGPLVGATTGFCGALTTFSGFAVETAGFARTDRWTLFVAYVLASVVAGVAAFEGGRQATRRIRLGARQ